MPSLIRCCGKVDGECGKEKGRGEEMEEVGEENERRRWRKRRREVEEVRSGEVSLYGPQ